MKITTLLLTVLLVANSLFVSAFSRPITSSKVIISSITASNSGNTCIGSSFNLFCTNAGSGYTYSWSGPNGYTSNAQNPTVSSFSQIGSFIFTVTATNGIISETTSTTIDIFQELVPVFTQIAPVCQGAVALYLPSTSVNGISGSWSPSTIDTSFAGTYIYTFTPYPGQCGTTTVMPITVNPNEVPTFTQLGPFCQGDAPSILPNTSVNGITGTWSPPIIDSTISGTTTYVFSAGAGQCAWNATMDIDVIPLPTISPNIVHQECDDSFQDGLSIFNLTSEIFQILISNSQITGLTVNFYPSLSDATNNTNIITNPSAYNNTTPYLQTIGIRVTNTSGCYSVSYMTLRVNPRPSLIGIGYSIVNNSSIQTLTVDTIGSGTYGYSLDGGATQTSPIFQNISLGNHTITITDLMYGCATTLNNVDVNLTATPAPTGNTSQSFSQGATLSNMQVAGQNIQWYSGVNKMASSSPSPLPLSTVLVNGTTYYASQKIGGYESATRLPVTAQIVLNNIQFELKGLTYEPNPVATNLSIKSEDTIDSISIYNFLGQLVSAKKCNATTLQIDLTSLNSGNYFVKVTSENKQSTIKIEKK